MALTTCHQNQAIQQQGQAGTSAALPSLPVADQVPLAGS